MGAHNFSDSRYGETADEAFKEAVHDAEYEYGHQPYNGTISTSDGFIMKPIKADESREEWEARMQDDDDIRKWGPCACTADPDHVIENGRSFWWFTGWAAC